MNWKMHECGTGNAYWPVPAEADPRDHAIPGGRVEVEIHCDYVCDGMHGSIPRTWLRRLSVRQGTTPREILDLAGLSSIDLVEFQMARGDDASMKAPNGGAALWWTPADEVESVSGAEIVHVRLRRRATRHVRNAFNSLMSVAEFGKERKPRHHSDLEGADLLRHLQAVPHRDLVGIARAESRKCAELSLALRRECGGSLEWRDAARNLANQEGRFNSAMDEIRWRLEAGAAHCS